MLAAAEGAVTLSKLAKGYLEARQYLAGDQRTPEQDAKAVTNLLTGNAVNLMIKHDHLSGDEINSCQTLMGTGVWSEEYLTNMTNNSKVRRGIQEAEIKEILEHPDGPTAHKVAKNANKSIIKQTEDMQVELMQEYERMNERNIEQPAINPLNA